jgi:uncharacterized protein YqeY
MATLKEKINTDYIKAFKEKDILQKNLLSVVKGEIQTIEKNIGSNSLSDDEVIKILNKTAKSLNETMVELSNMDGQGERLLKVTQERSIIQKYLPTQMTKEDIAKKVNEIINSGITNIGGIMKEFTGLQADRKIVSEVTREILK